MATLFDMEPVRPEGSGLKLNDAQRRAITHGDGPLLVIAGAGTGKTRVITERIRHLLESDSSLLGQNILGLTFTKKAAGEMKARVVKATGERGKDVMLATFHSFCETILKEVDPNRLALEGVDHWILLRRNLGRLKLEKFRRLAEPGQFLSDFTSFFSRCQDELVSSEEYDRFAEILAGELEAEKHGLDEDTYKERSRAGSAAAGNRTRLPGQRRDPARETCGSAERTNQRNGRAAEERYHPAKAASGAIQTHPGGRISGYQHCPTGIAAAPHRQYAQHCGRRRQRSSDLPLSWRVLWQLQTFPNELCRMERRTGLSAVSRFTDGELSFDSEYLACSYAGDRPERGQPRIPEEESCSPAAATAKKSALWKWILLKRKPHGSAKSCERLHDAGRRWKDFAVLYRQHAHRDHLVEELSQRKIPFVITKLSILEHPLVRDVLAYLQLIASPYEDIACARVLAAPAWHLSPEDLVRLTERAKKKRGTALYDVLQAPQSELPFDASHAALGTLLEFLREQRKTLKRRTAREILGELTEWLEVPQRTGTHERKYINQLVQFMKDWEPKSETRGLPEFLEYLDYFEQAGGTLSLEDDAPGDAVQLMTVHGAKGLEFPHVFLLRVNSGAFPARNRSPLFEFPDRLMKEELPEGDFHIQEERRLFYVAVTRAQERLTITTVTEKKGKVPSIHRRHRDGSGNQEARCFADCSEEKTGKCPK